VLELPLLITQYNFIAAKGNDALKPGR